MLRHVDQRLQHAPDVAAACHAATSGIVAARADLMPSVYLERGGRLRCMAVEGYWQVRDGMPPTAGVIGRTFRVGRETLVQGVGDSADYLEAGDGGVAELCVPPAGAVRTAGVLNVEAPRALADDEVDFVRAAAAALAARIQA